MGKAFLALLVTLLFGCGIPLSKEPTVVLHGDRRFTPEVQKCAEDSAQVWRDQTSGLADINVVWDYDSTDPASVREHRFHHKLIDYPSTNKLLVEYELYKQLQCVEQTGGVLEDCVFTLLGQVSPGGGIHSVPGPVSYPIEVKLVSDRLTDPHVCRLTAIHEYGHLLGLPHLSSSEDYIMYPSVIKSRTACLKKEDLLAFCVKNDCGNIEMKPCPGGE